MNSQQIPQIELQKLASNTLNSISSHSLGQWVKVQTKNEYIVVPRKLMVTLIDGIRLSRFMNSSKVIIKQHSFEEMEFWL